MFEYDLHWIKSGKVEKVVANNITEACLKLGYDASEVMMSECYYYKTSI